MARYKNANKIWHKVISLIVAFIFILNSIVFAAPEFVVDGCLLSQA